MKLRVGLHLDGQQGRAPANQMGVADVGPLGLLGILETQLGLVPPMVTSAQRTVQYRDCLHQLDNPERFYHKSYEADDFGTAATLLSWRDDWRLHGWTGEIAEESFRRLQDMVELEKVAKDVLSPGIAERLISVAEIMDMRCTLIKSITLIDSLSSFVPLWQKVLNKLPIQVPIVPMAVGSGLLGELQQAILAAGDMSSNEPLDWREDGSLHVIRGETALLRGRWIAEVLTQAGTDVLFVATSEAATSDSYLAAANYSCQGLSDASAFRPAFQLLPLLLELLWQPLNFNALIQFLTHPICPLSPKVRRHLAGIQSQYPGIGGPRWQEAIAAIEVEAGERAAQVRESIKFWIEHVRFDPLSGIPTATVLERAQRLTDFFRNSPEDASPALRLAYAAGYKQCSSFTENLARLLGQGVESLWPRQLEQLASQATARGNDNPLRIAEVGALPCITHPGAVVEPQNVVLWGPLDVPSLPPAWPWSKAEITALRSAECTLPEPESLLQKAAAEWLRPIMAAKKKLILILPPLDHESHPVWQMVHALIPSLPVHPMESMLLSGADFMTQVINTPLPGKKRWWQLPEGTHLPAVTQYSYSQLEKQIFNPYHWLLAYPANLHSGSLLSLVDDFRLKGLLAHSLVERLYSDADGLNMSEAHLASWFNPAFDQLITEEGAVYLMPGRRTDLENLRQALRRALIELREILSNAKVIMVEPERKLLGHFSGGVLSGSSDLILTKADETQAIIDMKWTGKSHQTKLEENRHLQLAVYSELLRQSTGRWPALAYFLFSQGKLLTRDDLWFPGTHPVSDRTGENTAQLWQRFLVTWKWRQEQFAKGGFEVVLEPGEEEESMPPEGGLPIDVMNSDYNECQHLAGWGEGA